MLLMRTPDNLMPRSLADSLECSAVGGTPEVAGNKLLEMLYRKLLLSCVVQVHIHMLMHPCNNGWS